MTQYADQSVAYYSSWSDSMIIAVANPPATTGGVARLIIMHEDAMQSNFDDLRFRDPVTLKRCAYWFDTIGPNIACSVHVLLYTDQAHVECLFGNATAASESNGADVFVAHADFSTGGIPAGWESVVPDDPNLVVASGRLDITGAAGETHGIRTTATFDSTYRVVAKTRWSAVGAFPCRFGFLAVDGVRYAVWGLGFTDVAATMTFDEGPNEELAIYATRHPTSSKEYGVVRGRYSTVFEYDGAWAADHAGEVPSVALPAFIGITMGAGSMSADWIYVAKAFTHAPGDGGFVSMGANPYADYVPTDAAVARIGIGTRLADNYTAYTGPIDARFEHQPVLSYSVKRGIADSVFTLSGQIDGHVDSTIVNFRRVDLLVPGPHTTTENGETTGLERIFFGFVPAKDLTYGMADNVTDFLGHDYAHFIGTRALPDWMAVMPKAQNPGTWIKEYFDNVGQWIDGGFTPPRPMFDTTNIHTVTGWGTTVQARDITAPQNGYANQMMQKIADTLGWIFYVRWREMGDVPSNTHQNPAFKIITVEAEDYNTGGEGVGYHDTTTANLGGADRTAEGVDLEFTAAESSLNIGWIRNGEWVKYTKDIPVTGDWTVSFRCANKYAGCYFELYVDGVLQTFGRTGTNPSRVYPAVTGSYESFVWSPALTLPLTEGSRTFKIVFNGCGSDAEPNKHMNLGAFDLTPPPGVSTDTEVRPAIYFVDENDIDLASGGLDLPPTAVIQNPNPWLVGTLKYDDNFGEVCTSVVIRYKYTKIAGAVLTPYDDVRTATQWLYGVPRLEQWVDHLEVLKEPIVAATPEAAAAVAQRLADDLVALYGKNWGTVTATFIGRTDLQLYQTVQFVGFNGVPWEDEAHNPYLFRITDIKYDVKMADVQVSITALPVANWSMLRRISRILNPDQVSETEAVVASVLQATPLTLMGKINSVAAPFVNVAIDTSTGNTILLTCRGTGTIGDRVVCIYSSGSGYVAVKVQ